MVSQPEQRTDVTTLYDLLARLLGTKPIHVRLAPGGFAFACGDVRAHIKPAVWFDGSEASTRVMAVGDQPPPAGANLVDLTSPSVDALSQAQRQNGLNALIRFGLKGLADAATIQRPVVVFQDDTILARAFGNDQRRALAEAAAACQLFDCRFE